MPLASEAPARPVARFECKDACPSEGSDAPRKETLCRDSTFGSKPSTSSTNDTKRRSQKSLPSRAQSSPKCVNLAAILHRHKKKLSEAKTSHWITKPQADVFFGIAILVQGLVSGVDTELTLESANGQLAGPVFWIMVSCDTVLSIVFFVELVLRIRGFGNSYICSFSGLFDSFLVLVSCIDLTIAVSGLEVFSGVSGVVRMLRLLRLLRLARLLQLLPSLRLLIAGLVSTFRSCLWAMVLLALLSYSGALFCRVVLSSSDDDDILSLFGSVPGSMLTHIKLAMVEAWPDIAAPMLHHSGSWAWYCAAFICVSNVGLLNVVTGVVCEEVLAIAAAAPPPCRDEFDKKIKVLKDRLRLSFQEADSDQSGNLDAKELAELLHSAGFREVLLDLHIGLPVRESDLLHVLEDASQCFGAANGMLRLRGTRHDRLSEVLQRDILFTKTGLKNQIAANASLTNQQMRRLAHNTGTQVLKRTRAATANFHELSRNLAQATRLPTHAAAIPGAQTARRKRRDTDGMEATMRKAEHAVNAGPRPDRDSKVVENGSLAAELGLTQLCFDFRPRQLQQPELQESWVDSCWHVSQTACADFQAHAQAFEWCSSSSTATLVEARRCGQQHLSQNQTCGLSPLRLPGGGLEHSSPLPGVVPELAGDVLAMPQPRRPCFAKEDVARRVSQLQSRPGGVASGPVAHEVALSARSATSSCGAVDAGASRAARTSSLECRETPQGVWAYLCEQFPDEVKVQACEASWGVEMLGCMEPAAAQHRKTRRICADCYGDQDGASRFGSEDPRESRAADRSSPLPARCGPWLADQQAAARTVQVVQD